MGKKCTLYEEIAREMGAREKSHHENLQKIRQQAEMLVTEIYNASKLDQLLFRPRFTDSLYLFDGKIGDDIYFAGSYNENMDDNNRSHDYAEIKLYYQGEKLGRIETQGGFVNEKMSGWISNWQGDNQNVEQPIADTTAITIISPAWHEKGCIGSTYYPKDVTRKVEIKYAPQERAERVLDNIYRAVIRSKQKAANAQKLSKLNLATKVLDHSHER